LPRHTPSLALRRIVSSLAAGALVILGVSLGAAVANAESTYSISGTVFDTTNTGIGSLSIALDDPSGHPIASILTAPDGTYAVGGVAPGNYALVTESSSGYLATSSALTVTSDNVVVNFTDPRLGTIVGQATVGGASVNGIRIAAFDTVSNEEFDADGATDASGAFSITLPATTSGYALYFLNAAGALLAVDSYDLGAGAVSGGDACLLNANASSLAGLASGAPVNLNVALNLNTNLCRNAVATPPQAPHHSSALLAQTGSAPTTLRPRHRPRPLRPPSRRRPHSSACCRRRPTTARCRGGDGC
jgi:hypothetical protein